MASLVVGETVKMLDPVVEFWLAFYLQTKLFIQDQNMLKNMGFTTIASEKASK